MYQQCKNYLLDKLWTTNESMKYLQALLCTRSYTNVKSADVQLKFNCLLACRVWSVRKKLTYTSFTNDVFTS